MKTKLIRMQILWVVFLVSSPLFAADKTYQGHGEVVTVDPVYERVTIKHGAIQGLAGDGETDFFADSKEMLKNLGKRDLVDFVVVENKGNTKIHQITKTGVAPEKVEKMELGKAVHDTLAATGEVAQTVTSPIQPVSQVVGGALGATAEATGTVLKDVSPEVKKKF